MKNFNNLSKLFRYVNEVGNSVTFDFAGGYLINKPKGIDTLSVSLSTVTGINQVGATVQGKNIQPRPVNITGYLVGDAQDRNKEKLVSVIRPDLKGRLYADDYYLEVYPTATPTIAPDRRGAQFQFSLKAAYPYWIQDDTKTATLMGVAKRFKFPWNISREYRFGEVIRAKFINIRNDGQSEIPFAVTFRALDAVENPYLEDAKSERALRFHKPLVAGEIVTVKVTYDRVYVNSTVDGECLGALDISSNLFSLAVGDNVWKPGAESGLENLQIDVTYSIEKVGITV